jgi:hypothetical protein
MRNLESAIRRESALSLGTNRRLCPFVPNDLGMRPRQYVVSDSLDAT